MRGVKGKTVRELNAASVAAWAADYREVIVDLGTGDGRYVRNLAGRCPATAAIGVDACQANLGQCSRNAPANALFVVADALSLPGDLHGLATDVTINFPWGSLLIGLPDGHPGLVHGLCSLGRDRFNLKLCLNAGALTEAGWDFRTGGDHIAAILRRAGFKVGQPRHMAPDELRQHPTTWAKRLAFGRDPRAITIGAVLR